MTDLTEPPVAHRQPPVTTVVGYAMIFCLAIPALLVLWAHSMPLALPEVRVPPLGIPLTLAGVLFIASGMHSIWRQGGGLPMNVAPPPKMVTTGVYAITRHPIYLGFCLACVGISVLTGSAVGLWVISPLAVAGCSAIVWGYERHDLLGRFGESYRDYHPFLSIPAAGPECPPLLTRVGVVITVFAPWLALYELSGLIPRNTSQFSTALPFEQHLPVLPWTELVYATAYLGSVFAPLLVNRRDVLRRFAIEGLAGTLIGIGCFVVFPLIFIVRPFDASEFAGNLLALERQADPSLGNALPSFHGFWALLIASALATRSRGWAIAGWTWALPIILSCITTGLHSIADMLAAVAMFLIVRRLPRIYACLLRWSEHLANDYHFRRLGPIRIISHSRWSFLAGAVGALMMGYLVGPTNLVSVILVAACTLLGGMLWAQFIEGSPRLLRPFGYYGAILGGIIGCLASPLVGTSPWVILAATSAAGPVIQAVGRIRCLVQGCCHGKPTHSPSGLRVHNPSSRVCALAHLDGIAIHPTQLYSILANLAIGALLLRLYFAGASAPVITGLYLALAGMSRFVEESYRGEPQTRRWRGLPEYQWYAILSTAIGCALMALPIGPPAGRPGVCWELPALALGLGLLTAVMMSVDFPNSNRRFARLTG